MTGTEPASKRGVGGTTFQERLADLPEPVARADDTHGEYTADEKVGLLRRALELVHTDVEPRTWQAFWLTVVEEVPTAQAAADLGMSTTAVRVARLRVLRRLRQEFADLLEPSL